MTRRWQLLPASGFAAFAARWDALNDAGFRSPVLHSDFVGPALTHFGDGSERIAFVEKADGTLDCAAIFARSNVFTVDSFQPSQAPIALWLQRDGQSGLPPGDDLAALAAAFGAATAVLGISQLDPELVARDVGERADRITGDYLQTARITITGTFDAYWSARGKNLRANMKKQRNKLDADGVGVRFDCLTRPEQVAAAIADYGRLESAGWKAAGGTAVSIDNAQGRFYREVFERFMARGMARIPRCFYGEQLAAMDLCIEHHGVLVILKTSFDETIRGTSPAFLMRHDYLPGIFAAQRLQRVEFYGRVMEWHTKWSEEIRMLYHATTYRWPLVARLDALRRARAGRRAALVAAPPIAPTEATDATTA